MKNLKFPGMIKTIIAVARDDNAQFKDVVFPDEYENHAKKEIEEISGIILNSTDREQKNRRNEDILERREKIRT